MTTMILGGTAKWQLLSPRHAMAPSTPSVPSLLHGLPQNHPMPPIEVAPTTDHLLSAGTSQTTHRLQTVGASLPG